MQQARNLLMDLEDAGTRAKFVLHDRDASFTATFDSVFQAAGIRAIRSAVQAPRMNSVMERWIGSCRAARVRGLLQQAPAAPNPEPRPRRCARCPMASPTWISSGSSDVNVPEA